MKADWVREFGPSRIAEAYDDCNFAAEMWRLYGVHCTLVVAGIPTF